MKHIECTKCNHREIVEECEEYTCSVCGFDSCYTIEQEIQTFLDWIPLEELCLRLGLGEMLIGYDEDDCEEIEEHYEVKNIYPIHPMGICVYEVQR